MIAGASAVKDAPVTAPSSEQDLLGVLRHVPLASMMGFQIHKFSVGSAHLLYDPQADHLKSLGMVHGGALMAVLDVALALAARTAQPSSAVITIEMKTMFLQAARGPLTAVGDILHRTGRMAFVTGKVVDTAGTTCAHATGTFRFVSPSTQEVERLRNTSQGVPA